jgi:hypothetical protein
MGIAKILVKYPKRIRWFVCIIWKDSSKNQTSSDHANEIEKLTEPEVRIIPLPTL